jgi:branched-chain amino acid transport system permease protein
MSAATTQTLEQPFGRERTWHPSLAGWSARFVVLAAVFGAVILITAVVPQYWADRISFAALFAIIGLSLNVVLGYTGQVSLGHHGFVGIAAFVAAYYATETAGCTPSGGCSLSSFATATLFAVVSGAVAAGLLGLVALRISGLYLALITLSYGFMAERSIFEIPALTRGGAGMPAPRPAGFETDRAFAFLTLLFLALVIFVDWRLLRSKVGRAILAIKNSEPVAASYGVNPTAYKVLAFVMSGAFAGLAGSLMAFRAENVVSNDFQFANSLLWVLMVVVGGLGNRTGVVIAGAFFALFPFLFELIPGIDFIVSSARPAGFYTLVIGPMLAILTITAFPGGIAEQISPITRWLRGQRFSMHPDGGEHHKKGGGLKAALAKLGLDKGEPIAEAPEAEAPRTRTTPGGLTSKPSADEGGSPDGPSRNADVDVDAPDVWGNLVGRRGGR